MPQHSGPAFPSVLMICYQYAPAADGGAERQAQRLAEELAGRGHVVGVVTTSTRGAPRRERMGGVDVRRLWTLDRKGLVSATFLPGLIFFLLTRGRRFDIWHVHQAYYHYLIAVALARVLGKRCVVKTAASGPFGDIARLRVSKFGSVVLRALPAAHAVVSLNRGLSRELEEAGVEARVIHNGVDTRAFTPATPAQRAAARRTWRLDSGTVAVAYVGRLAAAKGVDVLLHAWRMIESSTEGDHCELLLAGDGADAERLRAYAQKHLHRVRFAGRIANVVELLQAVDMVVLPSLSEGLSNAVLEAMAMGLPVVATNIPGLDEQVEDGRTGLLVPPQDAERLAGALRVLIRNREQRELLGRAGRGAVERRFAFPGIVAAYQDLYRDLIA